LRVAFLIVRKDLRERLRDRSALLIAIVAPLALAFALSLTIPDFSPGSLSFNLGLVDLDQGVASQGFKTGVVTPAELRGFVRFQEASSLAKGRSLARTGAVDAAIVLPSGLSLSTIGGRPARIQVIGNVDRPIGTLVARSLADTYASYVRTIQVASVAIGANRKETSRIATRVATSPPPAVISDNSTARKELGPKTYYPAAMAVFFLFFAVQYGISSLLDERRDGTLARMLVAPISRRSIVAGKALTSVALGVVSMTVLALATHFALGAHWGDPVGVGLLIVCAVLAATAVTALVTTLAKTSEQANAWLSIVAIVLGMLGGSFFPVAQAGGLLDKLSQATPHRWFLSGLQELFGGGSASAVMEPALVLVSIAAVCGSLALVRVRKLIEP
jgi:ABC-2 type transport system permease protein